MGTNTTRKCTEIWKILSLRQRRLGDIEGKKYEKVALVYKLLFSSEGLSQYDVIQPPPLAILFIHIISRCKVFVHSLCDILI